VPRGSVTRQRALHRLVCVAPRKGRSRRSRRIGSPIRPDARESEKVPRARAKPRQPFTRLGGVGLGSRVRPEIAANTAVAGRRRWTMLRRGSPRGDEASEVRRRIRCWSRQRSGAVGRFAEVSRFGVNRGLSHHVGIAMRRVPRRGAIVFENRIRELQTSVGRTGVAAGPLPRAPGSPSQRAGRPERGGNLARRDLRPSDVGRRARRYDRVGNAIQHQVDKDREVRGPKARDVVGANPETNAERFVQTKPLRARARAPRDRHDERRRCCNDSNATPSPEKRRAAALDGDATSKTSSPEANDRSGNGAVVRSAGEGPRAGGVPARGSDTVTKTSEVGSVEQDAGWGTFYRTCPASRRTAPASAGAMWNTYDEVGRSRTGNRPLSSDARGRRGRELTGSERVVTPRPCVTGCASWN